ncbi:MAG: putative lipid II flippase FtsW [Candidatus Roizmanbacteria bacterium]
MRRIHPSISMKSLKSKQPRFFWLIAIPLLLAFFGLFFIFEASAVRGISETGNSFHYLQRQFIWLSVGIVLMGILSFIDYKKLYPVSFIIMFVALFMLVIVLIPSIGSSINGARRWIDFGPFSFQPTEFAKIAVIIYLSAWFLHKERKRFFSFIVLIGVMMFLVMLQPDMGTSFIIFSVSMILYFVAGIDLRYLFAFIPFSAVSFFLLIKFEPYRFRRLSAFFNPADDPQGVTYHINQVLISLSNGGVFGQGFGASRQKYMFLPEAHTDSIFAIIGEEIGFIGSLVLITAYIVFLYHLYKVYVSAPDRYGKLLSAGIFAFFGLQIITNMMGMTKLIPMTGVPLPFLSYGGSHTLATFILLGIVISVARRSKTN